MGSIHHGWHAGVSFTSDLLSWKTQPLAPRVAQDPMHVHCAASSLASGDVEMVPRGLVNS